MRILKKILWICLFIIAFSLFNCSLSGDDCNCPKSNTGFLAITKQINPYSYIRIDGRNYVKEPNDTTIFSKYNYWGLGLKYSTISTTFQPTNKMNKSIDFSIIPSAYACDCVESSLSIKNMYPISLKVYTIYPLNDSISSNSLVNEILGIEGVLMKDDNIHVNTGDLLQKKLSIDTKEFDILFLINYNQIERDFVKFRIETELNTGEIVITETPLVRFQN